MLFINVLCKGNLLALCSFILKKDDWLKAGSAFTYSFNFCPAFCLPNTVHKVKEYNKNTENNSILQAKSNGAGYHH